MKYPKDIVSIYKTHYKKCLRIIKRTKIKCNKLIALELYAITYAVSDLAAYQREKYREQTSNAILDYIFLKLKKEYGIPPVELFERRVDFYGTVISGLPLHAHCLGGRDTSDQHPVLRCTIAFMDCCLNPNYTNNYSGPTPMLSALDVFEFSRRSMPLIDEIACLYSDIQKYTGLIPFIRPKTKYISFQLSKSGKGLTSGEKSAAVCLCVFTASIILVTVTPLIDYEDDSYTPTTSIRHITIDTPSIPKATISYPSFDYDLPDYTFPSGSLPRPNSTVQEPTTGKIFDLPSGECVAPLTIKTSGYGGYYFVLEPIGNSSNKMSFYVRGGDVVDIDVPLGTYYIYYASGDTWCGEEDLFGVKTVYQKCDQSFSFYLENGYYQGWTLTTYAVSGGTLDTDIIDKEDFPK